MSQKCVMEGWLTKKKGKEKSKLFSNENRRYFRIQELKGEVAELAFAYSYSPKDRDTKGFIYLRDITEIYDDLKSFTVVSAARTMTNEAPLPQEHLMWVQTLANYCPFADTTNIQSKISFSKKHLVLSTDKKEDDFLSRDAPISGKSYENSMSLFSRQADGETQSSFYLPSQGIHKVNSMGSNNSDIEESDGQRPTIRQLKSSDNYNFDISNDNTDETNVNGHHRHSLISNDNDVDREMSGIAGDAPYDTTTDRYNNYNNGNYGNSGHNNRSGNNSREGRDNNNREQRDSRELSGDHSARSGSGNRMSGDNPARREVSGRQEDHRLQNNRAGGHNGNTTNRLHQHITHTNNNTIPASNSNPQLNNSNSSTINNNNSNSGRGGPTAGVVRSNGLKHNFPSMEIEEMSLDVKPLTINKAAIRRNERTGSNDYSGSGNNTNRSRSDSDPDDTMPDRAGNPNRKATPRRYIPALHDNSSAEEDNSGENDHNAHRNREDKSDGTGGATPISSTNNTNNTTNNTNTTTAKPKPKMNMPSSAPPRRARDSLQTVEAAINGDGSSGPTKTRQSLDELLSRKGIKTNSNPDLIAESKTDSNAPSYRNPISDTPTINTSVNGPTASNRGSGAKANSTGGRGYGNNSDSDEDADIDFKAELRARRSAASSVDETNNPSGLTMGMTTSTSSNSINNAGNNNTNNTNNTSKPPRAPVSKSPYTPGHAPPQQVNNNYPNRVGTPPRRPQDPGSKIDSNFVNDNWDEDDEDLGDSRQNLARLSNKAEEKYNESSGKNNRNESKVVSSGVRSDENWLNEDFDD